MKFTLSISASIAAATLLSACSPGGNPMVDMCQKITQNLVGAIETWEEPKRSDGRRHATIEIGYGAASGETGVVVCKHPRQQEETYRTSPSDVTLNGMEVPQRDLMSASFGATREIAKDTAEHTKEKSIELAEDASAKAKELAEEAQIMAEQAQDRAKELAAKAETLAGDAKQQASLLAEEARVKATELAAEASDLSVLATEKARAAALNAAKKVQEQLEK